MRGLEYQQNVNKKTFRVFYKAFQTKASKINNNPTKNNIISLLHQPCIANIIFRMK